MTHDEFVTAVCKESGLNPDEITIERHAPAHVVVTIPRGAAFAQLLKARLLDLMPVWLKLDIVGTGDPR